MLDLALDDKVFIYDTIDAAIQEIDILFNTTNTELLGYTEYGTNWMQFMWVLNPSLSEMQSYIEQKLNETYFVSQLDYKVNVNLINTSNTNEDAFEVTIDLMDHNTKESGRRVYMF
jgi:hypothetical protein